MWGAQSHPGPCTDACQMRKLEAQDEDITCQDRPNW